MDGPLGNVTWEGVPVWQELFEVLQIVHLTRQVEGWIGVSAEELGYKKVGVTTAGQKSNGCSAQGFPQAKTPESKWQCCLKPGRVGYGTAEDLAECGTETLIKVLEVFIS